MRIAVDITHPAHVHFFRNAVDEWRARGHEVFITSRDKDITRRLLDAYDLAHTCLGPAGTGAFGLARELCVRTGKLVRFVRSVRPQVMTAIAGTFIAPAGKLTGVPTVTFTDTEHAGVSNALAFALTTRLVVPECYNRRIRRPHERYRGYHELAYLHPAHFTADRSVTEDLGVADGEKYTIMRFVSWSAGHDIGHTGMSAEYKQQAVETFREYGPVFISSERPLPGALERYRFPLPPERIHHALAFASLTFGESATMASESAMLGTPAVFIDSSGRGYTDELEATYGAVNTFDESEAGQRRAIDRGRELLATGVTPEERERRRGRILDDTVDVTAVIVERVESAAEVS